MYIGIDLGTSSVKAVIMDEHFFVLAQNSQPLSVSRPQALWSEQNPEDWWQATCAAVDALKTSHANELSQVKAIGLSGQMHGATLLDKNNKVLRPAILWNDSRAFKQCETLEALVDDIRTITCNKVMPGFTAPKLLWVKEHEPEIFNQVAKVLLPKDYLRFRLSGDYASDMSDSSGTAWMDVNNRGWSGKILAACDLTQKQMPTLFEGTEITGTVSDAIAKQWGVPVNTPIAAGAGDNAAAAVSMNVIKPGSAFLSLGTSGVYFVSSDNCKANTERGVHMFAHCLPNTWHSMNCHLSAANCLTWFAELVNADLQKLMASTEAAKVEEPLLFLPYLSGERSPHNNPYARGVFFGLSHNTTREAMLQAVLEGIAFNFKDGQDAFDEAGITAHEIYVVGGGSRSLYWGKILAAVLNKELHYCENSDVGAALGAAKLAYLAVNKVDPNMAFPRDAVKTVIKPDADLVCHYQKVYPLFKELYNNNVGLFDRLNFS